MQVARGLNLELLELEAQSVPPVYVEIATERFRAAKKHSDGSIELVPYDDPRWWTVVMEEIGEVARAFQESPERVHEELVQAAAMVTAWADASRGHVS